MTTWKVTLHKNIATICLILATFFNPLGFDALFALVMKWTGSFWVTDIIFYCLSALFFGLYFLLRSRLKKKDQDKIEIIKDESETKWDDDYDNWHNHY